jgi:membrane protease YdiL (CAAX protease family)
VTSPAPGGELPPAGWYADPWAVEPWRWWDGRAWTGWAGGTKRRGWFPPRRVRDHEGGIRGGGIAAAGFVLGVVLAIGLGVAGGALDDGRGDVELSFVGAELGLWIGLVGACIVAVRRHGTGHLGDLGMAVERRDLWIGAVAGVAARIGSVIIAIPFVPLLRDESAPDSPIVDTDLRYGWAAIVLLVVMVAVLTPIIEELYFRGLVQGVLTRRWGAFVAVWVQAALFASVHVVPGMSAARIGVTVWVIGAVGLLLGVLRWRYRRLAPGIVAHGVFNALALALVFALA